MGNARHRCGGGARGVEQGRYRDLYTEFAAAVRGEGGQPVPACEGMRTIAVLDAARLSAQRGTEHRHRLSTLARPALLRPPR